MTTDQQDPAEGGDSKYPPVSGEEASPSSPEAAAAKPKADPPAAGEAINVDLEDADDNNTDKHQTKGEEKNDNDDAETKQNDDDDDPKQQEGEKKGSKEADNKTASTTESQSDAAVPASSPPADPPVAGDGAVKPTTDVTQESDGKDNKKPQEGETPSNEDDKEAPTTGTSDAKSSPNSAPEKATPVAGEDTPTKEGASSINMNPPTTSNTKADATETAKKEANNEATPSTNEKTKAAAVAKEDKMGDEDVVMKDADDADKPKNEEMTPTGTEPSTTAEGKKEEPVKTDTTSAAQPMELDDDEAKKQKQALEEAQTQKEAAEETERKQKEAAEAEAKKQKEAAEEVERKQKEAAEEVERKQREAAEEELRKQREAAEAARKRKEEILKQWPQEENEEDRYDFPDYQPTTQTKKRKKKAKLNAAKKLKIIIRSVSPEGKSETSATSSSTMDVDTTETIKPAAEIVKPDATSTSSAAVDAGMPNLAEFTSLGDSFQFATTEEDETDREQIDKELEDSLFFFQETHEEQDPAYILYIQEREELAVKKRLAELQEEDTLGRKEIDKGIGAQSKEKQTLTNRNIEKYKLKAASEEKRDMQRLMGMYKDKMASNQGRIDQGIKILTQRHGQEMQKAVQQHRQHFQNQTQSPQAQQRWAVTAQQLQAKQQRQMQEFRAKGEEMKKKSKNDFEVQQEKLRNQYQKKLHEIEQSRRKVYAKIFNGFQQLRQRYLKRHMQRIQKRKEQLLQQFDLAKQKAERDAQGSSASGAPDGDATQSTAKENTDAANASREAGKTAMDDKEELRPPSPIKSSLDWINEELLARSNGEVTGASARHKQRKSVLSQVGKQLSVEIHNEGLWISVFADKSKDGDANTEDVSNRSNTTRGNDKKDDKKSDDSKDNDKSQETFIPWGVEAHTILQSIVCGEIPRGYRFAEKGAIDYGGALSVQGGHVRCVVTDLRTSDQTASSQRAASAREQEESNLHGLEQKIVELSSLANEAEATLNRAGAEEKDCKTSLEKTIQDCEKAKKIQQEFRTKFSGYLGPDGNPLPTANPNDRTELAKAIMRYKSNLDAAGSRYRAAKSAMTEARARTVKMKDVAKHAQKAVAVATALLKKKKALVEPKKGRGARLSESAESEKAAVRVKDVIASFHKTAEKRRGQLNQKRNSSASSTWVQSLPGLPGPLKKSLWHKMHRRRQQIVLRPSLESLTSDLREDVSKAIQRANAGKKTSLNVEEELLRAEQAFCLAMHPEASKNLPPSVPPSSGSSSEGWAEPGWHLILDMPKEDRSGQILPCAPSFPVFSKNLAELCSAPGRQAAAFSRTSHLRCLASNLSAVATATSLAETNPSVSSEVTLTEGDPLNITQDVLNVGYSFHIHPPAKIATGPKRKSSSTALKESADKAAAELLASKRQDAHSTTSASKANEASSTSAQKSQPKKRRTSKSSATGPSPRARKPKAETKRGSVTQQPAAIARAPSASAPYGRQPTPPAAAAAAAAAQYNQYINHSSPPQAPQQQQQANYQLMQQQQQQHQQSHGQQRAPPPNQYGSPQQRQMAQLRMMQQQQQQQQQQSSQQRGQPMASAGYPQPSPRGGPTPAVPPQPFFNPMAPAPGQPYQAPQHMQMQGMAVPGMQPMGQPMHMGQPQQQQRQQQQQQPPNRNPQQGGIDDSQNDPLFMLK